MTVHPLVAEAARELYREYLLDEEGLEDVLEGRRYCFEAQAETAERGGGARRIPGWEKRT